MSYFVFKNRMSVFVSLIAISIVGLVLLLLVLSYFKLKEKKNRIRAESEKKFFSSHQNDDDMEKKDGYDDAAKFKTSNLRLLQADELVTRVELGKGAFGTVYEGFYIPNGQHGKKIKVAIKVLNKCKATDDKILSEQHNELLNVNKCFFK